MNLSPRWVGFLNEEGHEAVHWSTVGSLDAEDSEIMEYAARNGSVVLTQDLDFSEILSATGGKKPSVVKIRSDETSLEAIGSQVLQALRTTADELDAGALVSLDPSRLRLRLLPLPEFHTGSELL